MQPLTIISGASKGIGKAIDEDLRKLYHNLILLSSKIVDFRDYNNVYETVSFILDNNKSDEINLILCASQIGLPYNIDLNEIDELFRINFLGNMAVIDAIRDNDYKKVRIVWFAGGGSAYPFPTFFAYGLTKTVVVRAVENLGIILKDAFKDVSIIALAPGAVKTDMLEVVEKAGCEIRTRTDISEPVNFVRKFITDEFDTKLMNGRFFHVRDNMNYFKQNVDTDIFKLRRIE